MTCFNQEPRPGAKSGKLFTIFNEQVPLIVSRRKNLSKKIAEHQRTEMPNWNRCTSPEASHSENESLARCVMGINLEEELVHTRHGGRRVVCLIKPWCLHTEFLSQCWLMGLSQRLTTATTTTTTEKDSLPFKHPPECKNNYIDHHTLSTNTKIR